jgi:DnaJ family protein C protein 13
MTNLFQSTSVSQLTLKRLYSIATYVYALISGDFALPQQSVAHQQEHEHYIRNLYQQFECSRTLIDACNEFNCSIQQPQQDFTNPNSTTEKHIIGTMGSLLGIIAKLLQYKNATTTTSSSSAAAITNNAPNHYTDTTATTAIQSPSSIPDVQRRIKSEQMVGTMFQTLYRLVQTTTGYKNAAELTTLRECLPYLWTLNDTFCMYSAYSVLNVLLSGTIITTMNKKNPSPSPQRDMETEYVNKNVILKCGSTNMIDGLVASLLPSGHNHHPNDMVVVVPSDLLLMVTSDILQGLLCSYHDTTSPEYFQQFIGALANRYRALLSLLQSSTPFVLENTALLLHLLSTHAPNSTTAIRDLALSSAIVLQHFYNATFSPLEGQRFLSRYLCSLWLNGPPNCDEKRLLKRIVPHGFLAFLNMPPLSRMEEDQLDVLERDVIEGNVTDQGAAAAAAASLAESSSSSNHPPHSSNDATIVTAAAAGGTNTARLRSRMTLASNTSIHMGQPIPKENFRIFFHVLTQDHNMADLIWNQQTRRELRIALESELEYIRRETEARGGINAIAWNHQQFHVQYPSLDNEVKVGDVYMRLWLQAGDAFIRSWDEPVRLFEHLFRRFLCEVDRNEKVSSLLIVYPVK